jgi:hypothetical protein
MRDTLRFSVTTDQGTFQIEQQTPQQATSHCDLCGRPVDPFRMEDGYTTCCNELVCERGTCITAKITLPDDSTHREHYRDRQAAIDAWAPTARRDETDTCEKATRGCSRNHAAISIETACETW